MAHFTQALKTVLDRSFSGKQSAMATEGLQQADISKLIREAAPLTADKLTKIINTCEDDEDRSLLVHAAVRDYVGEDEYQQRFCTYAPSSERLNEGLGGPSFHAQFPIDPRAEQVLRYLVNNVQHNTDVSAALILLGKFLELPAPDSAPTEPTEVQQLLRKAARKHIEENPPDTVPPVRRTSSSPAHPESPPHKR